MNRKRIITDSLLLFGIFTLNIPKLTGITFHEWFSVPLTLLLLCHLTLNRQFITGRIRRFGQIPVSHKMILIWDILLYWTMAVVLFSGFITSRAIFPALGLPIQIDSFFCFLHKQISPILLVMLGIHLGLQISWFRRIAVSQKRKEEKK